MLRASPCTSLTFSRWNTHVLQVAEIPRLIRCWLCFFYFQITSVWSQAGWETEGQTTRGGEFRDGLCKRPFLIGPAFCRRCVSVCVHTGKHSPTHFLLGLPVFYWVSQISSGNLRGPARHWESVWRGWNRREGRFVMFLIIFSLKWEHWHSLSELTAWLAFDGHLAHVASQRMKWLS